MNRLLTALAYIGQAALLVAFAGSIGAATIVIGIALGA